MPNGPINTELLDRAILFAVKAHAGTERRGKGIPYIVHPMEAMEIVSTLTKDQELMAAAAQPPHLKAILPPLCTTRLKIRP